MNDRINVGVLGAGQIVAESHLPVLSALAGIKLAWIADADNARAKLVASSFGLRAARLTGNPTDLPPADVVLIAIPYGARAPYIEALAARGDALYVEKPFALTLAEHDAYLAHTPPERVACGFQRRMSPALSVLRTLLTTRLLGELQGARVEFGRPGLVTGGRYSGKLAMAGGGVLFEVGVHPLDFVLAVLEASEVTIERVHMERHEGFDIHTEARLLVDCTSARSVPLDLLVTNLRFTRMIVELDFACGQASVEIFGDNQVKVRPRRGKEAFSLVGPGTSHPQASSQYFAAFWTSFLSGMRDRKPNLTSASASRVTTSALEQLYGRSSS